MSTQGSGPIEARDRLAAPLLVGATVSTLQVLAFYAGVRATAGAALPIRRGILLLVVVVVAAVLGSMLARSAMPHSGSWYAIPPLATVGFLASYVGVVLLGVPVRGLMVLVPAWFGSFIGAFVAAHWVHRPGEAGNGGPGSAAG